MKVVLTIFAIILGLYIFVCILLYFFQEKVMFFPQVLAKNFTFQFNGDFEEKYVEMEDGKKLHTLLFRTENSRGVLFYLHGNAGSLEGWGGVAETFTALNYDVLMPDYRGYGKSEGTIESEKQLHRDIQTLYEHLKLEYPENKIIVLGHSIGSGMAAKVAADNNPELLILQAPFYSLPDLMKNTSPLNILPTFLLKYKFKTYKFLERAQVPVTVLHGDEDEVIYYGSSLKLQQKFKPGDTLITLTGFGHNNFLGAQRYQEEIEKILSEH